MKTFILLALASMAILGCNSDSTSVGPNNGFEEFLPNPPSAAPKAIREMASIDSDHVTVGSDLFLQEKKIQKNATHVFFASNRMN